MYSAMHCGYFDTTRKGNHSSFLTPTVVGGRRPFRLKFALKALFVSLRLEPMERGILFIVQGAFWSSSEIDGSSSAQPPSSRSRDTSTEATSLVDSCQQNQVQTLLAMHLIHTGRAP